MCTSTITRPPLATLVWLSGFLIGRLRENPPSRGQGCDLEHNVEVVSAKLEELPKTCLLPQLPGHGGRDNAGAGLRLISAEPQCQREELVLPAAPLHQDEGHAPGSGTSLISTPT